MIEQDFSKGRANQQSAAAFARITDLSGNRARVLEFITAQGAHGATAQEVADALSNGAIHKASGRCSELKAAGLVVRRDLIRNHGGVLVAAGFAGEEKEAA
jgi:hypothetical protein